MNATRAKAIGVTAGGARRRAGSRWLVGLCRAITVGITCSTAAAATLTEHMDIACTQAEVELLRCNYRLVDGEALQSAAAEYDGTLIEGHQVGLYPAAGQSTAILVLVDTSDPARQPVIDKIRQHVAALLENTAPHRRFGLATFDTNLYLSAAVGSNVAEIRKAAERLEAKGRTTELYRNVREAVRLLGAVDATRRVLLLMSDGLAEDFAYDNDDVVDAAREAGVIIDSIGYPRSVARSVALQTVRRLSDETGGIYVQANLVDFNVPPGVFARMLDAADSGGVLEFDLSAIAARDVHGSIDLSLSFQTGAQSFLVLAPVRLPPALAAVSGNGAAPVAQPPVVIPPPRYVPATVPEQTSLWPWIVALAALLLLILAALAVILRRQRRTVDDKPATAPEQPLAFLVLDDKSRRPIARLPFRIGRGRNNDLVLADHSVSRLHAEIRRNDDGQLLLVDLESLNGVFVNDNRTESVQLREGDAVDIGDVRLYFTLKDESYSSQEATVLVRTRTPM